MNDATFVADASPLIALAQIDRLWLLRRLFVEVAVPPVVAREIAPTTPQPPAWIVHRPPSRSVDPAIGRASLNPGESEAMSLALERAASGVVLDDRQARRLTQTFGLPVVGTLVILPLAKRRGLLRAARPEIEVLAKVGFFFPPEITREVLADAAEESGWDLRNGRSPHVPGASYAGTPTGAATSIEPTLAPGDSTGISSPWAAKLASIAAAASAAISTACSRVSPWVKQLGIAGT